MNENEKEHMKWHIVNSLLAGVLVFLGSLTTGHITWTGVGFSFVAALVICVTKFKEYWGEIGGEKGQMFSFVA